jgi:hypothetical protein
MINNTTNKTYNSATGITTYEIPEEPLYDFKKTLDNPFDMETREITYYITKIDTDIGTARINLICSGMAIGKFEIPIEFIYKLPECKLSPAVFARPDGTLVNS